MMFRFAYPAILRALPVAIGLSLIPLWQKQSSVKYSMTSTIAKLAGTGNMIYSWLPVLLRMITICLLVIAAARPQTYNVSRDIKTPGVDIVLAIDTSGTMQALDFKLDDTPVTRLVATKKVVSDFIKKREFDRIGLVVFGEEAFTQSPLTMDKGLLLDLIDKMEIGMAGESTAIGSAIAIGSKRLKDLKAKSKILILLTDGRNNAGKITPEQAAEAASALGIKIYTIGMGGKGPAPFQVKGFFGMKTIYEMVDLDETTLEQIAEKGNGEYFRAADSAQLAKIYDIIDKQEKTEVKVKEFFHFNELYTYFLLPALLFFLIEIILKTTFLRVIP